jgi:hypothetical protein
MENDFSRLRRRNWEEMREGERKFAEGYLRKQAQFCLFV